MNKKTFCMACESEIPVGSLDEKTGNGGFYCSDRCRDLHRAKVIEDLGLLLTGYQLALEDAR